MLILKMSLILFDFMLLLFLLFDQIIDDAIFAEDVAALGTSHWVHKAREAQLTLVEFLLRVL